VGASLLAATAASAPAALAGPGSGPTAIVTLGDSYISGEAGRWLGNSINPNGDHDGTDRACVRAGSGCSRYDRSLVYVGASAFNGCHRSNVAEVLSASIAVAQKINLACSGGKNENIYRGSNGGKPFKGEPPQGDQLAAVARSRDVKLVVLSTGGNDLGFADIVASCVSRFIGLQGPCEPSEKPKLDEKFPGMRAGVAKAIDEVRAVMRSAGYRPWNYRIVIQSYPSVVPRASEVRYPEAGIARSAVGNCPFYDNDFNWARDSVVSRIADAIRGVAAAKRVQLMDLRHAFQGREMCAVTSRQADAGHPPSGVTSEWGRFVGPASIAYGDTNESFHPNAFGQRALGRCLTLVFARRTGSFACYNRLGQGPEAMRVQRTSASPGLYRMRVRVRPRRAVAGRRTCFRVTVSSGGVRVEGATVRFAGRRRRTGRLGRVRRCAALRAGVKRVRVRREGFRPARARVRAVRR
jgi:GDSL-like Lipase/Acylhydrolase family